MKQETFEFDSMKPLTIGGLISILEKVPPHSEVLYAPLGCVVPSTVASWCGIYAEPALGFKLSPRAVTAAELLEELRGSLNRSYTGWKGGTYYYGSEDPLHIDNPGECTNTEVARVIISYAPQRWVAWVTLVLEVRD